MRSLGYKSGMNASAGATESEIWNRTIRPEIGDLSPAAAQELLKLHLRDDDTCRAKELSSKANEGVLEPDEQQELDYYLNVGRALEFLKAKARLSLRETKIRA
jgi:hypothetical protein